MAHSWSTPAAVCAGLSRPAQLAHGPAGLPICGFRESQTLREGDKLLRSKVCAPQHPGAQQGPGCRPWASLGLSPVPAQTCGRASCERAGVCPHAHMCSCTLTTHVCAHAHVHTHMHLQHQVPCPSRRASSVSGDLLLLFFSHNKFKGKKERMEQV